MGRKAKWFGAVKKVFSPKSKKSNRPKENPGVGKIQKSVSGIGKIQNSDTSTSESFEAEAPAAAPPLPATVVPHREEIKMLETVNGRSKQALTVASASAAIPEEAAISKIARFSGKSSEEVAAIKIQTAFRGYLARRALRALRGLVRLKSLIHGSSVKRQATTTLRCMQTLARVQSQIRSRRIRMSEENQALQRQLLLKRERELEILRMGEEWDDSLQSKEQIESSLLSKQEAGIRRERALAYAFSHQWKNSSKSDNPLFMDPNNPQWGWSWMERWMAARPWESKSTSDKNLNDDHASVKSMSRTVGGEITNSYSRRDANSDKPSPVIQKSCLPASRQSPLTPISKSLSVAGKVTKSASPRSSRAILDDDLRSMISMQSERPRRHSLAGSSVRDDESIASLASSPAVPSYMAQTQSARARSRFQTLVEKIETTPDKDSVGSVKKRLSFPVGEKHNVPLLAGARRHSGPPKVEARSVKDGNMAIHTEQNLSNGGSK